MESDEIGIYPFPGSPKASGYLFNGLEPKRSPYFRRDSSSTIPMDYAFKGWLDLQGFY